MEGVNFEKSVAKLVNQMGFSRTEVEMALKDTSGNVDMAIQKLIAGDYKPPPYTTAGTGAGFASTSKNQTGNEEKGKKLYPNMPKFLSNLTNTDKSAHVEFDPTAPPLFDSIVGMSSSPDGPDFSSIHCLPPPYVKAEKESKIKEWENANDVVYVDENKDKERLSPEEVAMFGGQDKRCPVCFNALSGNSMSSTGPQEHIISHDEKLFHYSCFTRKHGPKCSYCYFPLAQADKDHELSGKYLVYQNKDYHVECYEKYAGPRCSACFNVIIERPSGEYSGNFVVDKHQEFHVECLQKKMYAAWRAKNS